MLTPFDIDDKVAEIRLLRQHGGDLAEIKAQKQKDRLYLTVLRQIAEGTIDARSLAIAVLKLED
jgi:hypothetical protein